MAQGDLELGMPDGVVSALRKIGPHESENRCKEKRKAPPDDPPEKPLKRLDHLNVFGNVPRHAILDGSFRHRAVVPFCVGAYLNCKV